MTPQTAGSISGALRTVWTEDNMQYQFAKGLEMDQALMDHRKALQRQVRFTGDEVNYPGQYIQMPIRLDMSPAAVKMRNVRQAELEQRVAKLKRGNKPSYRQRQKNARAARG